MKAPFTRFILFALLICLAPATVASGDKPNVLWIDIDDQSPWYSAYGEQLIQTPNIDALASEGVVFRRAYAPVPVCAPTRSAMITGTYPIRTGTHDMRSSRTPEYQIHLPRGTKTLPELFREAGYETFAATKDDFNFVYDRHALYSIGNENTKPVDAKNWKGAQGGGSWRDVPRGRPFYGKIAIAGGKMTRQLNTHLKSLGLEPVKPADVRVPAQYPDIPQVREHIATHYNTILLTDHELGKVIAQLKEDGVWGNTIIFLYSDHGSDLPRSKEFVYHEGLQVPFIVAAPGLKTAMRPGSQRDDIVSLMDITATSLALAGLPVPGYMDSRDMFDPEYHREYVFSSADRMSNVIDRVRSVMGTEFHYIRNFMTDRPLMNWGHREMIALATPDKGSFLSIRKLAETGKLTAAQAAPYGPRIAEELYHLPSDPDEVVNLASDPRYIGKLTEMRAALAGWIADTDDKGQYPRSKAAMKEVTDRFPPDWLHSPEFRHLHNKADPAKKPKLQKEGDVDLTEKKLKKDISSTETRVDGTLVHYQEFPSKFIRPRPVDVWLPEGYDPASSNRYPVIYMHDGQFNFHQSSSPFAGMDLFWDVDKAITRLVRNGEIRPAIVVSVWMSHGAKGARGAEYMPQKPVTDEVWQLMKEEGNNFSVEEGGDEISSDNYLKFLVTELKPFIDETYPTQSDRDNTFLVGSSMGGLISAYAISEYPEIFGGAACMSSHWPIGGGVVVAWLSGHWPPAGTHRVYFDYGTETIDAAYEPYQQQMDEVMQKQGYTTGKDWITRRFDGADHSPRAWRERLHIPLKFLLGNQKAGRRVAPI